MGRRKLKDGEAVIVKKYANRRLYDTQRSTYVTLEDLCEMVKEDRDFIVLEAKSEKDITRTVLTQILLEQDAQGRNVLPISLLKNLIKLYDEGLEKVASRYLETAVDFFMRNQHRIREQLSKSIDGVNQNLPHVVSTTSSVIEDIQRKNVELFEKAMDMVKSLRSKENKDGDVDTSAEINEDTPQNKDEDKQTNTP